MKLFSNLLALLFPSAVIDDESSEMSEGKSEKSDNKRKLTHNTITTETECKEIIALEKLELVASNVTKLITMLLRLQESKSKPPMALPDSPL
jgi:hypothetical protein